MNVLAVFAFALLAVGIAAHPWCTDCHFGLDGVGFMPHPYCRAYIRCEENAYDHHGYLYHFRCCEVGMMWSQTLLTCIRGTWHPGCSSDPKGFVCPDIPPVVDGECPPYAYFTKCPPGTYFNKDICACDHIYGYLAPQCDCLIHFKFNDNFDSHICNTFAKGEKHGNPKLEDNALLLDGHDDFIEFNYLNNWFVNNPKAGAMTFGVWVKPTADNYRYPILANGECHEHGDFFLFIRDSVRAFVGHTLDIDPAFTAKDIWTHIAAVFDGMTLKLYINCALVDTQPAGSPLIHNVQTSALIGMYGDFYEGYIDDVMICAKAMEPAELMNWCAARSNP